MALKFLDQTAGSQRIQFDNYGNTEFGQSTPNSPISFQGRPLLNGSDLSQSIARPSGMARTTGAVVITSGVQTTVSCPPSSGFGVVDGRAGISSFNSPTSFNIYPAFSSGSITVGYGVF